MSGIAEVLLNLGYKVSGSDMKKSQITERLKSLGAEIYYGHSAGNVNGSDVVVVSSAVTADNIEAKSALEQKIAVLRRAEMLSELMRMKYGIAIAGSHGKTTTTSLIASVLAKGGLDPTAVIGGRLNSTGTNAKLGQGEFLVAEADESDGSFMTLNPCIAVATNIDKEHMDFYGDMKKLKETFSAFLNKVPFYGTSVICTDDENIQDIIPLLEKRTITYGFNSQADYTADNLTFAGFESGFDAYFKKEKLGHVKVKLTGRHNVLNSLAAIAVGQELSIPVDTIISAIGEFEGIQRRLQHKGEKDGITVVDDYGHHPSEIRATLQAARSIWSGKIIVLFQPHRYSRTQSLLEEFYRSFYDCDTLVVTDIYPAGEKPIEGIDSDLLSKGIKAHGHKDVHHISEKKEILKFLSLNLAKGDMLITLGAGNVYEIGEEFLK